MEIDRGTSARAERGQRLTIFRRARGDHRQVQAIADAIIVAVRAASATVRIERTSDAVTRGDVVALHRWAGRVYPTAAAPAASNTACRLPARSPVAHCLPRRLWPWPPPHGRRHSPSRRAA